MRYIYTKQGADRVDLIDQVAVCRGWHTAQSPVDEGLTERPSESKRLVLTSLPHQLQPAVWLGRNPHRRLFKATKHKLGVSEVIQGRKCKAPAFPVGVTPADWLFRVPCGWRCHSEFYSKHHTCHSPEVHGPAQWEGKGQNREHGLLWFLILCIQIRANYVFLLSGLYQEHKRTVKSCSVQWRTINHLYVQLNVNNVLRIFSMKEPQPFI